MWTVKFLFPSLGIICIHIADTGFLINCGGPEINATKGKYSADSEILGNSSYFQSADGKWSVSYTSDDTRFSNLLSSATDTQGTFDSSLYKTARGSANSLKYYGLGMVNGVYNVELHFSEISITADNTWKSHGRRFFDVYVKVIYLLIFAGLFQNTCHIIHKDFNCP